MIRKIKKVLVCQDCPLYILGELILGLNGIDNERCVCPKFAPTKSCRRCDMDDIRQAFSGYKRSGKAVDLTK